MSEALRSPFHIIVNPVAGHGKAPEFVERHVIPLLTSMKIPYKTYHTESVCDAGRIGREILTTMDDRTESTSPIVSVMIAGGDGTMHEMIEGILEAVRQGGETARLGRWEIVILPLGTANALHSSRFDINDTQVLVKEIPHTSSLTPELAHSLSSLFLSLTPTTIPNRLPITLTHLVSPDTEMSSPSHPPPLPIPTHIVLSTSLHAALLSDSEDLRTTHPGIERFKMAAEQNLPVAFKATAILRGRVMQYSPSANSFVAPFTTDSQTEATNTTDGTDGQGQGQGQVVLRGPFSYFLSTTTVTKLEPTFVIAPTLKSFPTQDQNVPTMEIIVLRPLRDPIVRNALGQGEEAIANAREARCREVMGWAYQEGKHVGLTYAEDGKIEANGQGQVVAEVFRCEGFDWIPSDPTHAPSHIVCADGSLHTIPQRGRASVGIMQPPPMGGSDDGFYVFA